MALKVGADNVDALCVGATAVDAAFLGTSDVTPSEGGGGEPEWVPEGVEIYVDLVGGTPQARAWRDGTGVVAVDTLLGNDPLTESQFGVSGYESANLGPDGYTLQMSGDSQYLAFIGALKTSLLAGATAVLEFIAPDEIPALEFRRFQYYQIMEDGTGGIMVGTDVGEGNAVQLQNFGTGTPSDVLDEGAFSEGVIQKVAFTVKATSVVASANGRAIITQDTTAEGGPFETILIAWDTAPSFIVRSIAVYPTQADAALPSLSTV